MVFGTFILGNMHNIRRADVEPPVGVPVGFPRRAVTAPARQSSRVLGMDSVKRFSRCLQKFEKYISGDVDLEDKA